MDKVVESLWAIGRVFVGMPLPREWFPAGGGPFPDFRREHAGFGKYIDALRGDIIWVDQCQPHEPGQGVVHNGIRRRPPTCTVVYPLYFCILRAVVSLRHLIVPARCGGESLELHAEAVEACGFGRGVHALLALLCAEMPLNFGAGRLCHDTLSRVRARAMLVLTEERTERFGGRLRLSQTRVLGQAVLQLDTGDENSVDRDRAIYVWAIAP